MGSWQLLVNVNTSTGASFTSGALVTFTESGEVIEADNFPPPGTTPIFTPGHGKWRDSMNGSAFDANFLKLRLDSTNTFDRVILRITVSGDTLSGVFRVPSLGLTGTFTGTRINVIPF